MNTTLLKVCAICAVAGISGILPLPTLVKAVVVVAALIGLLLIKTEPLNRGVEKPDGYPQEVYTGGLIPSAPIC